VSRAARATVADVALPLPSFVTPGALERVYRVPYAERAEQARQWATAHALRPAADDSTRTALLLIDVQNTFCLPEFELFVGGRSGRGAIEDAERIASFVYRHLDRLTQVVVTLDTHSVAQIFHPLFWIDADGAHPPPHTVIHVEDVDSGRWRVNPAIAAAVAPRRGFDLAGWARHYARALAEGGRFPLVVWPYHSLVGGIGHALVSAVEEAVFFHAIARQAPPRVEIKGRNPLTENYSALRPEVTAEPDGTVIAVAAGVPIETTSGELVEHLLSFDRVIVAGEAKSH